LSALIRRRRQKDLNGELNVHKLKYTKAPEGHQNSFADIIELELTAIAKQTKRAISSPPGLREKTVFDRQSDYYLILLEGWNGSRLQPRRR